MCHNFTNEEMKECCKDSNLCVVCGCNRDDVKVDENHVCKECALPKEPLKALCTDEHYFGHCPHKEHENYYLNIGRAHWMVCDECKIKWSMGENLFSSWRQQNQTTWRANAEKIKDYAEVEIGYAKAD